MAHLQQLARRPVSITHVLGEILLTVGVIILLFAYYEAFWTNVKSNQLQAEASTNLDEQWEKERVNPRAKHMPELGEAFARMYIPAFGSDFNFAIVEGTSDADLLAGPGRYVDSQMPGEPGNFAVAGHRVGKGAPFNDLGNLQACDAIIVETATQWVTYRVLPIESTDGSSRSAAVQSCLTPEQSQRVAEGDYAQVSGRHITLPGNISVIDPIPGTQPPADEAGLATLESLLTLTTCHPQFSNAERMIVHAMETEVMDKSAGRPPAFEETI
ncbi:class E sortase [Corynebacterium breve]|uniref:Class E sortase n=1 Tax=Corynebacterium breve TaxID=3049799 RepID=A0ABY8VH60_9CORY|nr:class E sortase [Corynebacterium breve]WIM67564.1 class E sortase [Corynebacterium breve]